MMQIIKAIFFSLLVIVTLQNAVGQKNTHTAAVSITQTSQLANTLLWEISGKDLKSPSYLFGTMHLVCADDAKLSDSLRFAIQQAQQVYFEINMDNMMEMMGALQYINMNNHTKLSDLYSPSEYERVKNYFSNNKTLLPFTMMEHMKPNFISAIISESKFPCKAMDGMEQVIMQEAKKDKKLINGLETAKFQAGIFDSIPYQRQAKDLLKMIDSSGASDDDGNTKLIDVYRAQDLNKMQEMTAAEDDMADFLDLLLYNRNANWVKKMPQIMQEKQTIFAVGAGHLGGQKGVITLLIKAGYQLRPMKHRPGLLQESN
jgi:hypothetical protein